MGSHSAKNSATLGQNARQPVFARSELSQMADTLKTKMKPRTKFLLFALPWLIIAILPQLRVPARVVFLGSEYGGRESFSGSLSALRLYLHPLQPAATELAAKFANGTAPPEIWLKAPARRGDTGLTLATAGKFFDVALKSHPRDPWLLCARIQIAISRLEDTKKPYKLAGRLRLSPGGYRTLHDGSGYPVAGRVDNLFGYVEEDEEDSLILRAASELKHRNISLDSILELAKVGKAAEADNAFWDYQSAYVLTLAGRDGAAEMALRSAAGLPRYDTHLSDEVKAAIRVAQTQRAVSGLEMLGIAQRQLFDDGKFPQREYALLDLAARAEKQGDFSVSASLAKVAALMRLTAPPVNHGSLTQLQSAAWAGAERPIRIKGSQTPHWCYPIYWDRKELLPSRFAANFAAAARKAQQPMLANEAMKMGRDADLVRSNPKYNENHMGLNPLRFILAEIPLASTLLTAFQLELAGIVWLVLQLIFWRRMRFVGVWAVRVWNIIALAWQRNESQIGPAEHHVLEQSSRDLRMAFWFTGLLGLCAAAAMTRWSIGAIVSLDPTSSLVNPWAMASSCLCFVLAPLLSGFIWCFSTALWRYTKLRKQSPPPSEPDYLPPSAKPLVAAFMAWSVTVIPLGVLVLFRLTKLVGIGGMTVALPPEFGTFLGQNTLDFSVNDLVLLIPAIPLAVAAWALKWFWELPSCNRWPMIGLALRGMRATLGSSLIVGSWLFLTLLCYSIHTDRAVVEQISAAFLVAKN